MGTFVVEDTIVNIVHDIFDFFRNNPLFYDHYDKLAAILAVLLIIYFVGSLARNLLIGALIVFLLWGFRYEDAGYSRHVNRYTGAACDSDRECWFLERSNRPFDAPNYR